MEIDEYHSVIVQVTMKIQWNSNQDKCTDFFKKTDKYCKYFVVVETEVN